MITAGRHTRDRVLDASTDTYNEMQKLYDDDNLEEVYERAQVLLADTASPQYHRMKALLLLSDMTSDSDEAQRYYAEAEALWRSVRRQHALGHSGVDTELSRCRKYLDKLADVLESQRAENKKGKAGADPEAVVKEHLAQHEKEVAGFKAAADDEDQLERVDLAILGTAKAESMAILAKKAANRDVGASSTKAVILLIREHTELKENKERGIKLKLAGWARRSGRRRVALSMAPVGLGVGGVLRYYLNDVRVPLRCPS